MNLSILTYPLRYARIGGIVLIVAFLQACAATSPDVKINTSFSGPPANEEPTVTAHPTDPNNMIAGAHERFREGDFMLSRVIPYYTTDNGAQWRKANPLLIPCEPGVATSSDPWASGNAKEYQFGFIAICRNRDTAKPIGWMRAAYATSNDKGASWPLITIVSPEAGHADKIHVTTGTHATYVSYVYFGMSEIRVFASATATTAIVGFGYGPATVETGESSPTTYTAYIENGNRLRVVPVVWSNPVRIGASTDLGAVQGYTGGPSACDGAQLTAPGTRLRHIPIPQITRG